MTGAADELVLEPDRQEAQGFARVPARGATALRRKSAREKLVVVGNGPVAYKLCERLVQLGGANRFEITVFGEEKVPAYNRVRLTQCFTGPAARLLMAPREWYGEHEIQLLTGDPVVSIDRVKREVLSRNGVKVAYDKLVLATGARPFVPALPGVDLCGVFVYRTIADIAAITRYAPFCRRAAVLGGGLLGLEAADAIKRLGPDTWIVERGSSLLARQLDPEGSRLLGKHVSSLGLHVCTGLEAEKIEAIGPDRLVHFKSGEQLRVQMVIIAVGIRPRTELAGECGLDIHPKGGVIVNDMLATSDPRIFAIGECASHRGTFYGLAAPGFQMAAALGSILCGRRGTFKGADQSTALKFPGISIATLGDFQAGSRHLVSRSEGGYRRIALERNRIVGAIAVGTWPEQRRVQELIERRGRVWRWQRERFAKTGRIWRSGGDLPVAEWPAEAIICNCAGVRRGTLSAACAAGCGSADDLARSTGASTVCGSCRPLLEELTGGILATVKVRGTKALLVAALTALALVLAIAFTPALRTPDSVQTSWSFASLTEDHLVRQISGFSLAGLALASMVLSLRKRIARFKWGEVGTWKAVHATLGALMLVCLVSHTGFRLGHNLNFILMCNFLALAALGGLTGAVTAMERRLPARSARRMRALWTGAHIVVVWPLPVLVLFHVLVSYRF